MLNAFQQTASSVSIGRLYLRTFHSVVLSPVKAWQVIFGLVLCGVTRGGLLGGLVFLVAWLAFDAGGINALAASGLIGGSFCFASMGVVTGLLVKNPDDVSMINNFFITPMTFFGGSFFPLQNLPPWLGTIAAVSPMGTLNTLLRAGSWQGEAAGALAMLLVLTAVFFVWSTWLYRRYSE